MAIDRETQVLTAAYAGGIRSPRELANFMAQVTHESNGLNRLEESFRYMRGTAQIPVQAAWREGPSVLDAARRDALLGKPQRLAELMYGNRNGNDHPGDGFRYHGRGYLPVPGKDHYRAASHALGIDLVDHPELAADPGHAASIAVWYWRSHVPQEAREDVKAATQALNGRLYGLDDRKARFDTWERRLTPTLMERLAEGDVGKTASPAQREDRAHPAEREKAAATKERVKKRRKIVTETDAPDDPIDQEAMYEQQRRMIETKHRLAEMVSPHHHHHRHHHHHDTEALRHRSHPQHLLYTQALAAVHKLDESHHRRSDERSENLAAALAMEAHDKGMTRIDHVALSDDAQRTYAVEGDLNSPLKKIAEVNTEQAVLSAQDPHNGASTEAVAKADPDPIPPAPVIKPHGH
ncbi:MAG: hypothetical protein GAK28_04658 [Luteibacter sp.]|uniref:XVIPCD domain-containing protein n=1 Tax=Luteibacter sp. TaxID=1886636 RepID=UPI0013829C69|nr:XVIPCD domain-containing protein [Luteibacter sp.]KAF1003522.1 MAG: hypothetical protein GAK28_04658 [Luteibacter sp.]